jgi:hypothetical protein
MIGAFMQPNTVPCISTALVLARIQLIRLKRIYNF